MNASAAAGVTQAFRLLFEARFPIRQMRVVDDFGGDDERSLLADNNSAFNCRLVPVLASGRSLRAGGRLNPFENPEIQDGKADLPAAAAWADWSRSSPAMISQGDAAWRAFRAIGWTWGGDWRSLKDYMHFRHRTVNASRAACWLGRSNEAKVPGQMPAAAISVPMP